MTMRQVVYGETRSGAVEFAALLATGDSLTGTPTVTARPAGDLTISGVAISGTTVVFTVTGVVRGRRYRLTVTCATANSETLVEQEATIAGL